MCRCSTSDILRGHLPTCPMRQAMAGLQPWQREMLASAFGPDGQPRRVVLITPRHPR